MSVIPQNATITTDGDPPVEKIIEINHRPTPDGHIFKSSELRGLLVMAETVEIGRRKLAHAICELYRRNNNENVTVTFAAKNPESSENLFALVHKERKSA